MKLRDWLAEGEFNLAFSSCFFGFYAHIGAATALLEHGFRPSRYSGSSAGALVGAALATGMTAPEIRDLFYSIKRSDFWDPRLGLGLLRGEKLRGLLETHLVEDFSQLKSPFEAGIFDLFSLATRYISKGHLPTVVTASCSVPFLFHPVRIDGRYYSDGGIIDKTGINPNASGRTLGIYIHYKPEVEKPRLNLNHRLLALPIATRPNPLRLDLGPDAFREAYIKTKAALEK